VLGVIERIEPSIISEVVGRIEHREIEDTYVVTPCGRYVPETLSLEPLGTE
jgi:hypothetical protein